MAFFISLPWLSSSSASLLSESCMRGDTEIHEATRNGNGSWIRASASASNDWPMGVFLDFFFVPLLPEFDGRVEIHLSNRKGFVFSSSSPPSGPGELSSITISICDNPTPMAERSLLAFRSVNSSFGMVTYLSRDDSKSSDTILTIACCPATGMDDKILLYALPLVDAAAERGDLLPPEAVDEAGEADS